MLVVVATLLVPVMTVAGETRETTRDGILYVQNPSQPTESPSTSQPEEIWRIGGDDDEDVVFGVLDGVVADASGNVYLLDIQLSEVLVYTADGEYVRTIGREGEGPGEFRRPTGVFIAPAGQVAVVQAMPGKIVLLTPEGDPAGVYPVPAPDDGVQFFEGAARAGDQIVVAPRRFSRRETGADITSVLIRVDTGGNQTAQYLEQHIAREFAVTEMDEKAVSGTLEWSVSPDGRVLLSDDFDSYRIRVLRPDATVDRVIEREYEHRARSAEEMERRTPRVGMGGRRGRHGRPRVEVKPSKTDRDILQMFPRDSGSVWVLNSRGAYDVADGAMATFDVFDADGHFVRQITLRGEGDFDKDEFHIVGNRLYVVTGVRSARAAMRGAESEKPVEDEEIVPMAVICYDLGPVVQGSL